MRIGIEKPIAPVLSKIYIGARLDLQGKTALVGGYKDPGYVSAQFDEFSNPYSHGWWVFNKEDFEDRKL